MNLFTLFAEIILKDGGIADKLKGIENQGKSSGSVIENAFSKLGSTLLKVGGIIGVGLGLKSMMASAEAGQKTLAQMDAVLKSTGDASGMTKQQLIALADAQSKVTTFSKGTTMAGENLLLTFTGIGKNVFPATIKAAQDMSTAMGTDLNSSCMTLGKALNDPVQGMTKLTKQGVTFTDAQKAQITAMEKAGNVAGAQGIILQELQKEFGGSAKAAGSTFAGQLTILKNTITGVGGQIGSVLIPYMTSFVSMVNTHLPQIKSVVTGVINTIVPKFKEWITVIVQIAEKLLPSFGKSTTDLKSKLSDLGNGALKTVSSILFTMRDHITAVKVVLATLTTAWGLHKAAVLASNVASTAHNVVSTAMGIKDKAETGYLIGLTVAEKARAVATKASAVAQGALNVVMSANPIALVVIAITALVAGFVLLYNKSTTFRNFVNQLWNTLKQFASSVKADVMAVIQIVVAKFEEFKVHVTGIFNEVSAFFHSVWATIQGVFETVINTIVSTAEGLWNTFSSSITTIFNGVKTFFTGIWEAIKAIFGGVILIIIDLVTGNFNKLKADIDLIWNAIKTAFSTVWNGIKEIFSGALDFLKNVVTTAWNGLKAVTEAVWNGLKSFLEGLWNTIKSLASTAWNGLKDTVLAIIHGVVDTAKSIWDGLLSWFEGLPSRLYNAGSSMFNSLKNGISSVLNTITSVVQSGFNGAINFITGLPSKALKWGSDFIDGLVNGIKGAVGKVTDAVSGVADKIRSFLHFSVPDEGSLTDYESWMPDFMEGLSNGISKNKYKVIDQVKSLTNGMKINAKATVQGVNDSNSTTANSETKQPIILQLILQNGKVIAEYLIDDINALQGKIQLNNSRLNYGRR